jgi:peptidyl-prolyl cis-trans isomerase SurA
MRQPLAFQGLVYLLVVFFIAACTSTQPIPKKDPILAKLGTFPYYVSDFKYVYEKSVLNKDSLYVGKSVRDYLDLFVNFKLKILDAQSKGLDTTADFKRELATYEEQLAQPYLLDQATIDSLTRETYRRMQEELNVSHILIKVAPEAGPADTLRAYQQIKDIREQILKGENFEKIALQKSQDPSAKQNKGNLGYFTALQMVLPFETTAYNTKVGQVSDIVRTQYGYHIIKVNDRRSASGKVTIAHIMMQVPQKSSPEEVKSAKNRIDEVYNRLQKGENWDLLCKQFSEDGTSKDKGGVLPEFKVGEVLPEIEQTAFHLKLPGDFSQPIQSSFGWHIIKLVERKGISSFREAEPLLKQEVAKESRFDYTENVSVIKLKKANGFTENPKAISEMQTKSDARILNGSWSFNNTEAYLKQTLFTLKSETPKVEKAYSIREFFDYLLDKQAPKPELKDAQYAMTWYYEKFKKESLLGFERKNLTQKRPEYRNLINEYREGMMLFALMQDKIWNRAIEDTAGARQYFLANREKFRWGQRATATIYRTANEEIFNQLKPFLNKTLYPVNSVQVNNLYFDKDDKSLDEESVATLAEIINYMRREPNVRVEISGHADPSENKNLSAERIDPVVKYLTFKRIDRSRIITKDYGNTNPVSKTDRAKNRRIEFSLLSPSKRQLENILNLDNPLNLKVFEGTFQKGDNEFLDKVEWKPGNYTLRENGQVIYIEINDLKEPRLKEIDEARGYLISDYQKYLEQEWIKQLKQKYPVEINQAEVDKLIKR